MVRLFQILVAILILPFLLQIDAFARFDSKGELFSEEAGYPSGPPANPYVFEGTASWYSRESKGIKKTTANNEKFDDRAMTCANWSLAFNQMVRVTNLQNGKSVVVRVNDRGPHYRFVRQGRVIDLTKGAFKKIADTKNGLIKVKVEML